MYFFFKQRLTCFFFRDVLLTYAVCILLYKTEPIQLLWFIVIK